MDELPESLRRILADSFALRTTFARRDGTPRTLESTYGWSGGDEIVLSGFPGKRDWVASLGTNPMVVVHTVEGDQGFEIPARARVLRDREERLPHLFAFVERWSLRPGFPRRRFGFLLGAVKLNRRLGLPWWGPFYLARRIFDGMPCVLIRFEGAARPRMGPPPEISPPRLARNQAYAGSHPGAPG
ncbi:MAG: hypothetical protein OSB70_06235 [Myxococcota bacterium]|nr:hypothetical protein [Myxococcota bacterium]